MNERHSRDTITIAAVGDIAFVGTRLENPDIGLFDQVRPILQDCDLVIGNLECPLTESGQSNPAKCSLKGHPGWATVLKSAGFGYLSLANNHMMDFGPEGLENTIANLGKAGLPYSGAGSSLEAALSPEIIHVRDQKVGILAYSSVVVASRCYAKPQQPGVAPFQLNNAIQQVSSLRKDVDYVIICLHWGIEHYRYPSPEQRRIARQLANSGADLVIGHHPHVLQGVESMNGSIAAYSLGNFVFDDFEWTTRLPDGSDRTMRIALSQGNKTGGILKAVLSPFQHPSSDLIVTLISDRGINPLQAAESRKALHKLSRILRLPGYSSIWKLYSLYMEWQLRFSGSLSIKHVLRNYKKIRPRHLMQFASSISKSLRIVTGKSTNPYD